ncbi:beta strand repeat-containing protein [Sodalinema gerasimenkoae]|uniref:beta strand repeat-containing protein n=1 Tax=Sodalinema gerasimenkoae TaxID=2862348 RepID=UPI001359C18E|nr:S-layer family protein [Sodalinema gerasimenkoae]
MRDPSPGNPHCHCPQKLAIPLLAVWLLTLGTNTTQGQVIPDSSLPENSRVLQDESRFTLEGGTLAGENLFHSFESFSLPAGWQAHFNNPAVVERIITRVTGENLSQIDGLLSANHQASLIFLNPNGIRFGETAQLQLGGSFIASTADHLIFADGSHYHARAPQGADPLLTVSVPIGLQFGNNPAPIANQSRAASGLIPNLDGPLPLPDRPGLTVAPGETLGLFAGELQLSGGNLSSFGGQILLGTFGNQSTLTWTPSSQGNPVGTRLNYDQATAGGPLHLSQGATVSSSGLGGGAIDLYGDRIQLEEGASLRADTLGPIDGQGITIRGQDIQMSDRAFISSSSFGSGAGGDITLSGDRIEIRGTEPGLILAQLLNETFNPSQLQDGIYALSFGTGPGGSVSLSGGQIDMSQGAVVLTTTLNQGSGGNIQVNGSEFRLADSSLLLSGTTAAGRAGDIRLTLDQLRIENGGIVSTASSATGTADSGNLEVIADRITMERTPAGAILPGGLFTSTLGRGNAGNISIETRVLEARGGMQISAASSSAGEGGNLRIRATDSINLSQTSDDRVWLSGIFTTSSLLEFAGQRGTAGAGSLEIETQRLSLSDGSRVSAATAGEGAAGSLTIQASESVEVSGEIVSALGRREPSALFAESRGAGEAGNLRIITPLLRVVNGGEIAVRGLGTGAAGNLEIRADRIEIFNNAEIGASTVDGAGGNLRLDFRDLQLGNQAQLSVSSQGLGNAGDMELQGQQLTLTGGQIAATSILGQGGNLNLNLENVAILQGGSTLSTRAGTAATAGGDGGNMSLQLGAIALLDGSSIDANAFQGAGGNIQIATQGLFLGGNSQITASSEFGIDGTVSIQTPDTEAGAGLVELTERPIDPASQIASGCAASDDNSFLVTGRGGLPEQPSESLRDTHSSWGDHRDWRSLQTTSPSEVTQQPESGSNLAEATTWVYRLDGTVALIAPRSVNLNQDCL